MSMVEVAYELKDRADFMVASQFVMPLQSVLGCEEWLGALVNNPALTTVMHFLIHHTLRLSYLSTSFKQTLQQKIILNRD